MNIEEMSLGELYKLKEELRKLYVTIALEIAKKEKLENRQNKKPQ